MYEEQPTTIGPYRVLERVGEGGMGSVYLAEQKEPFQRRVAVKLIKLGLDTKAVLARFELEHQALALMNHPNIARVYDAGATSDGRPYFVMEYVPGIPITDYCDRHRLGLEGRLHLFVQVCHAVQHAHQKGIIHRDLKPSNILVMLQDDQPLPKIIDFGVAKATNRRLTEKTIYTELGQAIGTPAYMSPEQAEMAAEDVDTRTDVYSLGAILYQLIAGDVPLGEKTLLKGGFVEIQRMIREVDPPRPSERLSHLSGDVLKTTAQHRAVETGTLARRVRGDLDWITMKAIEKERTRRYSSASELGQDIERHLRNEPVVASPPSLGYRLRKFAARNRAFVTGLALAFAALLAGLVVSITLFVRAEQARQGESEAKVAAVESADRAEKNLRRAEDNATLLAKQKDETEQHVQEAERNLALFHWESGDRAYEEGRHRLACREYLDAIRRGVESADEQSLAIHGIKKDTSLLRPQLASALARAADGELYLDPGVQTFAVSPSGHRVAVSSHLGPIAAWAIGDEEPQTVLSTENAPGSLAFLDEHTLAYGREWWMRGYSFGFRYGLVDLDAGSVTQLRLLDELPDAFVPTPDRTQIALGQSDGRIRVIEARTGADAYVLTPTVVTEEEKTPERRLDRRILAIAISADGRRLLSYGRDRQLRLWDLDAKAERVAVGLEASAYDVAFLGEDEAFVWDRKGLSRVDLKPAGTPQKRVYEGTVLGCAPLGARRWFVATGDSFGTIDLDGRASWTPLPPQLEWVRAYAEDPGSDAHFGRATDAWIAIGLADELVLYDRAKERWSREFGRVAQYSTLAAIGGDEGVVAVWGDHFRKDAKVHRPPEVYGGGASGFARTLPGHDLTRAPRALAVSPDGRRAITCDDSDELRLYEAPGWDLRARGAVGLRVYDVAFSGDGKSVVAACADRSILRFSVGRLSQPDARAASTSDLEHAVLASHPRGGVWVGYADGTLELRNESTLAVERSLRAESGGVQRILVSRDGGWLAANVGDTLELWPRLAPAEHWSYREPKMQCACLSDEGSLVGLGLVLGDVQVLDTSSRQVVARYDLSDRNVPDAAFDADDGHLVFAGFDSGPSRIRMPKWLQIARFADHKARILDVAGHPNSEEYASVDAKGTISIRRLRKPRGARTIALVPREPLAKEDAGYRIAYSSDGSRLVVRAGEAGFLVVATDDGRTLSRIPARGAAPVTAFALAGTAGDQRLYWVEGTDLLVRPLADDAPSRVLLTLPDLKATRIAVGPKEEYCVVGTRDGRILLVDTTTRSLRWQAMFPDRRSRRDDSFLRDAVDAVTLLAIDGDVLHVGIAYGGTIVSFRVTDGSVSGRRAHRFSESRDAMRLPEGVTVSTTIQRSWLMFSSDAERKMFVLELPEPADAVAAVDLLADGSALLAADGEQVFLIPLDLRVLGLKAEDVPVYVETRLRQEHRETPAELRQLFPMESMTPR